MMMVRRVQLALMFALLPALAQAIPILDQVSPADPGGAVFRMNDASTWQQQVIAGTGGLLTGVEFFTRRFGLGNLEFFVNLGTPWQVDANDFFGTLPVLPFQTVFVDVSSAGIFLTPGDSFVLGWHYNLGLGFGELGGSDFPGLYPQGALFLNAAPFAPAPFGNQDFDIAFRTYVDPVPEPATIALLGSGLVALGARRRRAR